MSWHGVEGHDDVVEQFRRALRRGRLASSFLFVGLEGIGKRRFALTLAQALLCQTRPEAQLDPCGTCPGCVQVATGSHPDLEVVARPAERSFIPLELLIGDADHRGQEGLCHHLALKPFMGGRKVAIIDDADLLNEEGANCLLKTLEEPPPQSVLVLIGTSPARQLPTIRSRCQTVRFRPLAAEVVAGLLVSGGLVEDPAEARRLADRAGGSVARAAELADPKLREFRDSLFRRLAEPLLDSVPLAGEVAAFVEAAGTQAAARRGRLRQVVDMAAEFYRQSLRGASGVAAAADFEPFARDAAGDRPEAAERTAARLERCLLAAAQIDRNVNQTTLVECWLDDLART